MDELIIEPGRVERQYWRDLWRYRELFYFLAWRDLLIRYKQTLVGVVEGVSRLDVITLVPVVDPLTGAVTFQTIKTKIFAQGNINAKFESSGGGVDPLTGTAGGGSRLSGKASLDLFADLNPNGTPNILNTVSFRVDGFKQSATASAATITFNPVGGG